MLPQLAAYAQQANASNAIVFAAILVRMALFSEARFQFQAKDDKHLFGNTSLAKLEEPFGPDTTTGDLLARMEQDVFLAGNAYIWDRAGRGPAGAAAAGLGDDRRPRWCGSAAAAGTGGRSATGSSRRSRVLDQGDGFLVPAEECVHWAPVPDPAATSGACRR